MVRRQEPVAGEAADRHQDQRRGLPALGEQARQVEVSPAPRIRARSVSDGAAWPAPSLTLRALILYCFATSFARAGAWPGLSLRSPGHPAQQGTCATR